MVVICVAVAVAGWFIFSFFRRSMMLGYVDSAIGTLRTTVDEESHFSEAHPNVGYTCAISDLGSNEMLRRLAKSEKRNGYAFELNCPARNGTAPQRAFQITARPLRKDMPAYCSDQTGILRYDESGSPAKCRQSGGPL
jgi:hypothetical protein